MSPNPVFTLLAAACAAIIGLVGGYYVGAVGGPPLSLGLVAILGLILVAVAIAYRTGARASASGAQQLDDVDGQEVLRQELDRSRRFGHTFTLVRLRVPAEARSGSEPLRPDAETLRLMLRGIDRAWSSKDVVYILLPESSRRDAQALTLRLSHALPGSFASDVEYAEFPTDGVTAGALLANMRPEPAANEPQPVRLVSRSGEHAPEAERKDRTS